MRSTQAEIEARKVRWVIHQAPHVWKDNNNNPIVFDGIDLSDSLLGKSPGKREEFVYFNGLEFGAMRVKNYKMVFTAKDTWLGPEQRVPTYALGSAVARSAELAALARPSLQIFRHSHTAVPTMQIARTISTRIPGMPRSRNTCIPSKCRKRIARALAF